MKEFRKDSLKKYQQKCVEESREAFLQKHRKEAQEKISQWIPEETPGRILEEYLMRPREWSMKSRKTQEELPEETNEGIPKAIANQIPEWIPGWSLDRILKKPGGILGENLRKIKKK